MRVGLFVPCYVDVLFPEVAVATLELLERLGVDVAVPLDQTCCGQPMANTGCQAEAAAAERRHVASFRRFDHVVSPSGSCVHHVRHHLDAIDQTADVRRVRANTYELVEYLHDVLAVDALPWAEYPRRVGLHDGCQALRGLGHGTPSETPGARRSKTRRLLELVRGLELVEVERPDECCGFGGTFSVGQAAVSARMGLDRVTAFHRAGAQVIASPDMACLMHQRAVIERQGLDLGIVHVAQVLNGAAS